MKLRTHVSAPSLKHVVLWGAAALAVVAAVTFFSGNVRHAAQAGVALLGGVSPSSQTASVFPQNHTSYSLIALYLAPGQPSNVSPNSAVTFVWNAGTYGANTFSNVCYGSSRGASGQCQAQVNSQPSFPLSSGSGNVDTGALSCSNGGLCGYYGSSGGNTPVGSGYPGGNVVLSAPASAGTYTYYFCSYAIQASYGSAASCASNNISVGAGSAPPVFNSFTTSASAIAGGSSVTIGWSVSPAPGGTSQSLWLYGGQFSSSGTQEFGWSGSVNSGTMIDDATYQMAVYDSSYGYVWSPQRMVTVGAPKPPASVIASCSGGYIGITTNPDSTGSTPSSYYYRLSSTQFNGGVCPSGWTWSSPNTCSYDNSGSNLSSLQGTGGQTYQAWVHAANGPSYVPNGSTSKGINSTPTYSTSFSCAATDLCSGLPGNQTTYPSGSSPANSCTCPGGTTYDSGTNSCLATYDFSISASNASIMQGASGATTVSATRLAGSASTYINAFSQTGLPSGVTSSFSPSLCTPTNASCTTLNLTVGSSVTPGSYPVTIYAYDQSATILRTTNFTLTVSSAPTFTFSLSSSPSSVSVVQGSSVQSTIGATLTGGSATPVNSFFATGNPSGMTVSFSPSSCTPTNASCTVATFAANSSVTPGTYTVYIYGTGGGNTMSTPVTVTVTAASVTPAVSIATSDDAGESGTGQGTGTFVLSRVGGGTAAILPVLYTISGTATYGTDYTLGGTCVSKKSTGASIPANASSCTVIIVPVEDSLQEGTETITLTLTLP